MSVNKKPRLCEILGVEVGEKFWFNGSNPKTYYIGEDGLMYCKEDNYCAPAYTVCYAINHPEEIFRKAVLSDSELAICRALGAKWVSRDDNGMRGVCLWDSKPQGHRNYRNGSAVSLATVSEILFPSVKPGDCICTEWSEPEINSEKD